MTTAPRPSPTGNTTRCNARPPFSKTPQWALFRSSDPQAACEIVFARITVLRDLR